MQRSQVKIFRAGNLHYAAQIHYRHTIGDVFNDSEPVRNEKISKTKLFLKFL